MGMINYEPICVKIIPTVLTNSISNVLYVPHQFVGHGKRKRTIPTRGVRYD